MRREVGEARRQPAVHHVVFLDGLADRFDALHRDRFLFRTDRRHRSLERAQTVQWIADGGYDRCDREERQHDDQR